ncbi:MAG: SDR family NAD(P)-dependent oxidoreductase [Mycobacterium sp.]|uniref:SDR family NAD(P)-dependent oxidoreductase n=1 Tax=Mycobacterium sp. TaxID=1785 RepID=UPI003F9586DF
MSQRVALVTGAGAGVGRAVALRLARERAAGTVLVNDVVGEAAERVAHEVTELGAHGVAAVADVTSWDAVCDLVDQHGPIDVLVNNAGVPIVGAEPAPFAASEPAQWDPWLKLNLQAVMYCTRAVLTGMLANRWGRIITVISDAARVGEAGLVAYSAAKAGAAGFMRAVAREVGPAGITCNCVALGAIKHGKIAEFLTEDIERKMVRAYPVSRLGTPDDAAGLIAFLAGADAEWITGQTYPVNGGFSMAV